MFFLRSVYCIRAENELIILDSVYLYDDKHTIMYPFI